MWAYALFFSNRFTRRNDGRYTSAAVAKTELSTIADPLSPTTRAERRWLLVSSVILVALTWGGLVPTKLGALGMEINHVNVTVLVVLTCAVTSYFLAAFIYYYRADRFASNREAVLEEDRLVDEAVTSGVPANVGMTPEKFKATMGEFMGLQFRRYIYSRYQFEYWSALIAGIGSLAAAVAWLMFH
jgi:hypothetical protein